MHTIVITLLVWNTLSSGFVHSSFFSSKSVNTDTHGCGTTNSKCDAESEAYAALSDLHNQLDDDKDGGVDPVEADEFARDELRYTDGFDRTTQFHIEDKHISKEELWQSWKLSSVYNWTAEEVVTWLVQDVELPQYAEVFIENKVNGQILPKLAVGNMSYLSGVLKIKNSVHRRKIALKVMDVVLFGPPKKAHNYMKDLALTASLLIAVGGCWFAYIQHRFSKNHLMRMNTDLDTLSKAEKSLLDLQMRLEKAEQIKAEVHMEKQQIEEKYKSEIETAKREASRLAQERSTASDLEEQLRLAEEELEYLRTMLTETEAKVATASAWHPPRNLLAWLQITYEVELQYQNTKKAAVEQQLSHTKELCQKVSKKRGSFLGSMRIAHSTDMDDMDKKLTETSEALEEVSREIQERTNRWAQIEELTCSQITSNPGLAHLRATLPERIGMTRSSSSVLTNGKVTSGSRPCSVVSCVYAAVPSLLASSANGRSSANLPRSDSFVRPFANRWKDKIQKSPIVPVLASPTSAHPHPLTHSTSVARLRRKNMNGCLSAGDALE